MLHSSSETLVFPFPAAQIKQSATVSAIQPKQLESQLPHVPSSTKYSPAKPQDVQSPVLLHVEHPTQFEQPVASKHSSPNFP